MSVNVIKFVLSPILNEAIKNRRFKYMYFRFATILATHGIQPPLAASATQVESSWKYQRVGSRDRSPELYIKEDNSTYELFREVLPYLDKNSPILEIGCNVGRNLNYLYKLGYNNLTGIEIGAKAVELMKTLFPEMYNASRIITGNAPIVLKTLRTDEFELVFCHSVLVNIHPKYNYIFKEMTRVSRKFILSLENEGSFNSYPRDFKKLFEKHKWKMIVYKLYAGGCSELPAPFEELYVYENNTIRLFVPDKSF